MNAITHKSILWLVSLFLGCALVSTASLHAQSAPPQGNNSSTLNLKDADIRVLINTVSEATGRNFIIDPRVKAKVTIVSSKPMKKDEIYEVFLSILEVHGFAAVPGPGITKIVPNINAKQGPIPTITRSNQSKGDHLVTRIVTLKNVAASQMVPILRQMIPQQATMAAYVPTNTLIIADRAANIQRILGIIRTLDKPDNKEIDVIPLEHASATEVKRIIDGLTQQGAKNANMPNKPVLSTDERTNSILITGDKTGRLRIRNIIAKLDVPLESGGNTKVIFLKYAKAKDIVTILQGVSTKTAEGKEAAKAKSNTADIQADENNNALVITAPTSMLRDLEAVIRQLDIPRAQVMIEAIIAEVSTDLTKELGSQFIVGSPDQKGVVGGMVFSDAGSILSLADKTTAAGAIGDGLLIGGGKNNSSDQFAFLLKALQGDAATNILSTPSLVTLDNVEAEIVFGENVPFTTGSFSNTGTTGGAVSPFQTIQRQDIGIKLKVKPQVNGADKVKLEIEHEISDLKESANSLQAATTKRSIKTEVMATNGQVIVLGGLIQDRFLDTQKKVPLLGSIPILGRLFSFSKTQKVKSNLMVFIRPLILDEKTTSEYVTKEKYGQIRNRQLEAKIGKRGLMKDSAAELPEIEALFIPLKKPIATSSDKEVTSDTSEQ